MDTHSSLCSTVEHLVALTKSHHPILEVLVDLYVQCMIIAVHTHMVSCQWLGCEIMCKVVGERGRTLSGMCEFPTAQHKLTVVKHSHC